MLAPLEHVESRRPAVTRNREAQRATNVIEREARLHAAPRVPRQGERRAASGSVPAARRAGT